MKASFPGPHPIYLHWCEMITCLDLQISVHGPRRYSLLDKSGFRGSSLVAPNEDSARQRRGHRFDPWSGKIACAAGQHSLWTAAVDLRSRVQSCNCGAHLAQLLKPACPSAHALQQEKPLPLHSEQPPLAAASKMPAQQ